jgi:dipeptidyl aminopeptidase/acylaminoacyl peptidase
MLGRLLALLAALAALAATGGAQRRFTLTIENIMRGPALVGHEPRAARFSSDSAKIYFEWKQAGDAVLAPMDTYEVNRDGTGLHKLSEGDAALAPPADAAHTKDGSRWVWARGGDLYFHDRERHATRRLTRTADSEGDPHLTPDGKRVWFTRLNNLYAITLEDGGIEQLTDIRPASAEAPAANAGGPARRAQPPRAGTEPPKGTDSQEFVKKEERDLLDVVRQQARQREDDEARRKRENPRQPMTLQARQTVTALALSPDGKRATAAVIEAAQGAKNTIVPNFVTESGYTEDIGSRSKVGDSAEQQRIAIIGVDSGEVKWVTPDTGDRRVRLSTPIWSEDGTRAVLTARSDDNKDRWLLALDPATGKTRVLATDHDDAWLGGQGGSGMGWLKGDRDVYFLSEREGFSHLYAVSYDGGPPRALTSGKWEVLAARLNEDRTRFYLTTNEPDPSEVHLFSMPAEGGERTRITKTAGSHRAVVSPDEKWIADIGSYTNRPPELYVMENRPGAEERRLTTSPTAEFTSYPWQDVPVVHFTASDGVEVPARLYKPGKYARGGPAVIFVHGAGYLQDVHKWWSSYYHEYMFHHFLMEHGYLVLDVDYRGSAGYGREWRTSIYRHMGGRDLLDHVDAARWLVSAHGVSPKRIGIYGGSYGGFITLMALFTEPDVFAAGAALRPVTDWAHYNHGYTSGILNLPQKDPEAYRRSSPIYFAAGLKGALLICHGMVDTNVHFQDTARLVQKLIELGKTNWELAVFPVEDHGFVQPSSWTDEYRRIFALFEENLR